MSLQKFPKVPPGFPSVVSIFISNYSRLWHQHADGSMNRQPERMKDEEIRTSGAGQESLFQQGGRNMALQPEGRGRHRGDLLEAFPLFAVNTKRGIHLENPSR